MNNSNSPNNEQMIVDQSYWDKSYSKLKFFRLQQGDQTTALLNKYLPRAKADKSAFEIGCFPGRFIAEIGELGYVLHGCDTTPRVATDLGPWLESQGYAVGEIIQAPYQDFIDNRYDLVASFGFIEHFDDYENVFLEHCKMVNAGGYLVVQFPNFRGLVQHKLHQYFDLDNLNNHVIAAMELEFYRKILPADFDTLYCRYYGGFDFWTDDFKKRNSYLKRKFLKLFMKTKSLWKLLGDDPRWSPHGMIIAKRKPTNG
ncbi:methyltransferase domain-containing protein [Agrobacterium rosae]|uniref:class I SAM-dependent methyltransferase n=1 Tax=Agrobacterium rosae TaxID=1972867 RepID=UPI0019D3D8BE|nr:class I SAM-dependent methyltransferase [Agrobacterium rosae]MBN7805992.1 methyltransferase domain-containing protein [Agrobacterium rosae]